MSSSLPDSVDLRAFVLQRDQAAFARIVRRHADFIYACCLRQLRDPGLAEDAEAQAVFFVLARKASTLRSDRPLAGWLFSVARLASRNVRRSERRRRQHETEAAERLTPSSNPPPA